MASHGWVCAVQPPVPCAFVHEEANLVSHLASLAVSKPPPVWYHRGMTLSLQATFLPAAFVIPASQLDCACTNAPLRLSTHASAATSIWSHSPCTMQPPLPCAFVHEEANLVSHLASLAVSTAPPVCC